MRVAALYDIHGNAPALEHVLHDVQAARPDLILVGGDVLPGPMPRECLGLLDDTTVPVQFIKGNGDREVVAAARGAVSATLPSFVQEILRWTASQLSAEELTRIDAWPASAERTIEGLGAVSFHHATARNDTEIFTRRTPDAPLHGAFSMVMSDVIVVGHTHMPFRRVLGARTIVNAGSVGMPYQRTGASWLLLGPTIEFRHTAFDLGDAAERVRATRYPQANEFADQNLLSVPGEDVMLERLSRAEIRE